MNLWRQSRLFRCLGCGLRCLHDMMYFHVLFVCQKREQLRGK